MIDGWYARRGRGRGAARAVVALVRFGWVAGWCLVLVVGVPVALTRFVGWPLPRELPTLTAVQAWLEHPLTDGFLLKGTACVIWLLWAGFTIAVVVEIIAAVRRVRVPRLRLANPVQGLAAGLVGAMAVTVTAAPAATVAAAYAPAEPQPDAPDEDAPAAAPLQTARSGIQPADATTPSPFTTADHTPAQPAAAADGPAVDQADAVTLTPVGSVTVLIDGRRYEHTVVTGESLWRIAETYLGDPHRWPEIWELNKGEHWPHVSGRTVFSDPDLIFPGWVLTLPADAIAPPAAQPTDPAPQTPPQGTISPPAATATPSAGPTTASPTPSAPAEDPDGVVSPPAVVTPPAVPTPSAPAAAAPPASATTGTTPSLPATPAPAPATPTAATHPADGDEPSSDSPGWIQIAGGFIGAGLAAGLLYAAALVWKRRRHRYQPTPITTPVLDDRDLIPPLAALTHIRQTLRRHTPELLDRTPERGPTVRQYTAADVKPPLPPPGPTGAELAGVGNLPASAGLGLSGPAALHAARALLVAALTSGRPHDPDAQGQVIVPAATLATLLGVSAVDLGPMHRLIVAPSFADALTLVEEEIIRRSRILADRDATDVPALRAADALAEPLPQLLLIADVPEEGWHTRLATATRLGTAVEIGAALIGHWPHGITLTVAADGSTTGGDGQRVAVLDPAATSDILAMLREAHGDNTSTAPAPAPAPDSQTPPAPGQAGEDTPTAGSSDLAAPQVAALPTTPPDRPATPPRSGVVHVRVLGSPAILGPDGTPVRGLRAKSLELLVYLAVHRRGASLDDIMEAIWGDATARRAAERLSTCVANLRGVIRIAAQTEPTENAGHHDTNRRQIDPVVNTGGHYHLDPTLLHVDWWTVLDEYAHIAAADDDTTRLTHLLTAIGTISGGLADGMDYEWIDTDREHARRLLVKIFAHAAHLLADTDPHQARTYSDIACDLDPLSDELARRAMHAAARVRDAEAIRDRLAALRRELDDAGIELDPDTEHLAATLLRDLANR